MRCSKDLRAELLCREKLMALPREQQASDIGEVEYAILETTGHLGLLNTEKAQVESTAPSEA